MKNLHVAAAVTVLATGCSTLTPAEDPVALRMTDLEARLIRIERVVENQSLVELSNELERLRSETTALRGELETLRGIWRYDANKLDQVFSPKERYASGNRNPEGFDFDATGRIFVTQHGRDQLHENWPKLYTAEQGFNLPAEEVTILKEGAAYGWPKCYYDGTQKKLVLGPEYGGDGGKAVGDCDKAEPPVAAYPAHWAPNDLKIYKSEDFPAGYRGGAFIAFHGSWNRAPETQEGYRVVFQPMSGGNASGEFETFANGFAGVADAALQPGTAKHRPTGLAQGPDGALYVTDDMGGRIYRITYGSGAARQ